MGVSGQNYAPTALAPGKRGGTHFTGGWVGLRDYLEGEENIASLGFDPRTIQPSMSRYIGETCR